MWRSLRSKLILASVLWTAGLLMLMHMFSMMVIHVIPNVGGIRGVGPVAAGVALMALGVVALRRSLLPFGRLREKLAAARMGKDGKIAGDYPSEVQPLIDNLNALLEDREKAVKRAIATAGDLAHGLKTPLAVLVQEADRAEAAGNRELADGITQQVDRMSRQVNYQLARARAAASGSASAGRCRVADCADALARTVAKLHAGRGLQISCNIGADLWARVQREDLDEMLGNLLDNACKWAGSRIVVEASRGGAGLIVSVDDDGPGLAHDLRSVVLERGVRIDQAAPGSGLGLAIVRDLAELYGGSISLEDSPLGGLSARVSLGLYAPEVPVPGVRVR
jgi:signal transduction histidine kinase